MNWIRNLGSFEWWMSVVLVGVAIHLLSYFLLKWTPKLMASVSSRLADRSKASRSASKLRIEAMVTSDEIRLQTRFNTLVRLLLALMLLVIGLFGFASFAALDIRKVWTLFVPLSGAICIYYFFQTILRIMIQLKELGEATEQVIRRELTLKWIKADETSSEEGSDDEPATR